MNNKVRKVMFSAVIAAIYVAMTMALAPISYGPFQFRVSEVLTILPYFFPLAVPGLFGGCIIANLLSPYGFIDMMIGSMATLIAALMTMRLGKSNNNEYASVKALACFPPVIVNAVFIGAMIAFFMIGAGEAETFWPAFALNAVQVGFGQAVVLYLLGLPLMIYLPRMGVIERLKRIYNQNDET